MLQPNNHNIILTKYFEVVKKMYKPAPNFAKTKRGANRKLLHRPQYERIYWVFVFNLRSDFSQKQ